MKELFIVIRIDKINETKRALASAGIASMTARKALGRGRGKVDYLIEPGEGLAPTEAGGGSSPGPKMIPKRVINIALPDDKVAKAVETVIRVNKSGRPGDGRIFVTPLLDAVRVRTGETGDLALDEQI